MITNSDIKNTGFYYGMSLISGKYKMTILYLLAFKSEKIRYNQFKNILKDISFKMLTQTLKELEKDELIKRHDFNTNPPKVEYSLTEKGKSLIPVMNEICKWGESIKTDAIHIFHK